MSKTLRWMALASLLLLCTAGGTYYLAEHKEKARSSAVAAAAAADQTTFSGLAPGTNRWHVFALLSLTSGVAVGLAALMVVRQESRDGIVTIGGERQRSRFPS